MPVTGWSKTIRLARGRHPPALLLAMTDRNRASIASWLIGVAFADLDCLRRGVVVPLVDEARRVRNRRVINDNALISAMTAHRLPHEMPTPLLRVAGLQGSAL
jgi:hypothetical protein